MTKKDIIQDGQVIMPGIPGILIIKEAAEMTRTLIIPMTNIPKNIRGR